MLFSNTNKNGKVLIILNVESSAVHGSLVLFDETDAPKVLYTHSSTITWKPHTNSTYLIKTTEKALRENINMLIRQHNIQSEKDDIPKKISAIHYALSSPWLVSEAKVISMTFENETKISKEFILKLIEDERTKLLPSQSEPLKIFEEKIFDIKLNGYSLDDWQNKWAKSLDISFTVSIAGAHTVDRFASICEQIVKKNNIFFHSSLLLQFIGIEKFFHINRDYSILNVHGELTDIAIIRDKSCVFFGSFPIGTRTLIRKVSNSTKIDQQSADSLITLFTGGHLDVTVNKKGFLAIESIYEGWVRELGKTIDTSKYKVKTIEHIILTASAHENSLTMALSKIQPNIKITMASEIDLILIAIHSLDK